MTKELKALCRKIANWLNKKIDIPFLPEWLEGIIFNKGITAIVKAIAKILKKGK